MPADGWAGTPRCAQSPYSASHSHTGTWVGMRSRCVLVWHVLLDVAATIAPCYHCRHHLPFVRLLLNMFWLEKTRARAWCCVRWSRPILIPHAVSSLQINSIFFHAPSFSCMGRAWLRRGIYLALVWHNMCVHVLENITNISTAAYFPVWLRRASTFGAEDFWAKDENEKRAETGKHLFCNGKLLTTMDVTKIASEIMITRGICIHNMLFLYSDHWMEP